MATTNQPQPQLVKYFRGLDRQIVEVDLAILKLLAIKLLEIDGVYLQSCDIVTYANHVLQNK